MIYMWF